MLRYLTTLTIATAVVLVALPAHADEIRDSQWPLEKLHANDVWRLSQGEGVTVATLDSGADANHPDLIGQVLPGKSFMLTRSDDCRIDPEGHGTGMAALIAGHNDDSHGIAGLAPKAKILPICVTASANTIEMEKAIRYAVDHGAKVVNMALGSSEPRARDKFETAYEAAVRYAYAKNVVLVASVGNRGIGAQQYPSSFPGVIAVAAVDENGKVPPFSQHGPQVVLAAPGVHIRQADFEGEKRIREGTSDSAAYTSATAALVFAKYPHLTAGQVINRLTKTTTRTQAGQPRNPYTGHGIINPKAALSPTFNDTPQPTNPLNPPGTTWPSGYVEAQPTPPQQPQKAWWPWLLPVLGIAAGTTALLLRSRRKASP